MGVVYEKELKKIEQSKRSGCGADEIYIYTIILDISRTELFGQRRKTRADYGMWIIGGRLVMCVDGSNPSITCILGELKLVFSGMWITCGDEFDKDFRI
ncbi:uncharacterized protein LOC143913778 isoform X2 [Arctopsyche grandis]|uniref:uncharacterized protein LOC143913778 isoform X2 n=1 Tax=Arctopsyche grandis TaxID=121162 RepID=UPI00406D6E2F